ncbi:MAG TPA: metal-dependent hydrolase, partial [Longimicrobiales bacterium]|nr:metal-dependent hydrolase [Longimicrobiales bacterium]
LAYLGVLTHPVLDWMNTYGMRWWLPFHGGWSYGDALFIVDPWIWLGLGGALFLGLGARHTAWWLGFWGVATALVLSAPVPGAAKVAWSVGLGGVLVARAAGVPGRHGATAPTGPGGDRPGGSGRDGSEGLALWASLGAVAYVAVMVGLDLVGRRAAYRALQETEASAVLELVVAPLPADPFAGEIVARTPEGDLHGRIRWTPVPRVELFQRTPMPAVRPGPGVEPTTAGRAASVARAVPRVEDYLVWSRLPTYEVTAVEGGWRVRVGDARYPGVEGGGLGGPTVDLDERYRVRGVR